MRKNINKTDAPKNDDLDYKNYRYLEVEKTRMDEVINNLVMFQRIITNIYQSPNNENCNIIVIKR